MTRLTVAKIWKDPFSPEEVAKTPTEAENRFNSFADALLKAQNKASEKQKENNHDKT